MGTTHSQQAKVPTEKQLQGPANRDRSYSWVTSDCSRHFAERINNCYKSISKNIAISYANSGSAGDSDTSFIEALDKRKWPFPY